MSSGRRTALLAAAGVLLLLLLGALAWVLLAGGGRRGPRIGGAPAQAANPALNVRFTYSTRYFSLAPYNGRAEFPLRLDAIAQDGASPFTLFGKRLGGLGRMLGKDPAPMLYDFAGQQSDSMFSDNFGLQPLQEPRYEDAEIGGKLALHQVLSYRRAGDAPWPEFFPPVMQSASEAYIEGWTLFTADDLFYFYAIGPAPLEPVQRSACLGVLNSLKFNAVQGEPPAPAQPDVPPPPAGAGNAAAPQAPQPPPAEAAPGAGAPQAQGGASVLP